MSLYRLRYFIFLICIIICSDLAAQTTIFSDPGPYAYTGIDNPESESFNADISNCSSVSISYDFAFSLPWQGSGNMESCDECPGCGCDPDNSVAGGCTPCWDFLQGTMQLDGSIVFQDLIGDVGTTDADQSGTVSSGFICTDGATSVDLELMTNTWASDETSTFSNIVIMCYQATAIDITTDPDLCAGQDVNLEGEALNNADVDTWMWTTDGGSSIDNDGIQNTFATGASDGETYTLTTTDANGCSSTISETISLNPSPEGSIDQSSDGELCFGECTSISFDFIDGLAPYNLDLTFTISGVGFPVNFNAPSFAVSDEITVCYDLTGFFPSYDPGTQTIGVPEIASGQSGVFTLNSFTDANGCEGIVTGSSFSIDFLDTPEANTATLEECDEGGGLATFDLTEMDDDVNGGSGETVQYYGDPGLTTEIFSPYFSPSSVIYATVTNGDCTSPRQPVNLVVLQNGDAGNVALYCTSIGSTDCTICDTDGVIGEMVSILFSFDNPAEQHVVKLNYTDANGSTEVTYTLNPNESELTFTITGLTTFEILEVTEGDGCVDDTDLGGIVTVNYLIAPELDPIGPFSECGSVTLPAITGTNIIGNTLYYTETNQGGDSYAAGEVITMSTDLFVYTGLPFCFDEIMVDIDILPGTTFDVPNDTLSCGPYILPEITGTGVNSTAVYSTLEGGAGILYSPGETVISSTTLYIFDPSATCSSNEPSFNITVFSEPVFEVMDIDTCGIFILPTITGNLLLGTETYFSEPNGMGMELMVGDTIFTTDTIYAYDSFSSCIVEEEIIIKIGQGPTAGVGDTIDICNTSNTLIIDLPNLLIEPADTLGMWSDDMGIIMDDTDSTQVDISGITGAINFMYVIENIECGNDTSHLQINIHDQIDAGGEDLLIACETATTIIDLNAFWNIQGTEDTIIVMDGAPIDVSTPSMVNLSDLDPGIYNVRYIVGIMDTICTPDTANLTIEIIEAPNAGDNVSTTTCAGNTIMLEGLLENNNTVGTFSDPINTGALSGSSVNTTTLGVGTFTFIHTVPGNGTCPSNFIEIDVEVTNNVTAGNPVQDTICYTTEINLFDYLDGASLGGTFLNSLDGNVVISDGIMTIDQWASLPPGTAVMVSAVYTVGDNIDCIESNTTLELLILPEPIFDLRVLQNTICGDTLDIEIDYSYFFGFEFTIELDGNLPELPISIPYTDFDPPLPATGTLPLQIDLESYNLPSGVDFTIAVSSVSLNDCITDIDSTPDTFNIGAKDTLTVNTVICGDDFVMYEGQTFNALNPTGEITIERPGQCDSIIIIDLVIPDPATSLINNEFCTGQSINVGGTVYNEMNPSGMYLLPGMAANGCDSTVIIDLSFGDASIEIVVGDICEGDEGLTLNGKVYDENNLMGSDTIIGGSVGGCDSIINVNLTLFTVPTGIVEEIVCDPTFSTTINGVVFNFANQSGTTTILNGSVNGCDSLVDVNITFLNPAIGSEDGPICPNEFVVVNGSTYDKDRLIGFETFTAAASNGCDSIVSINLTLLDIPEGPYTSSSCDPDYFFEVNGNTYDIDNQMGTELILGGAANGCDSIAYIQLSFDGIIAEATVLQPNCIDPINGQVSITNITGTAPFNYIDESGASTTVDAFPYTINNLTGDGILDFADADGCHAMVNYSISEYTIPVLTADVLNNQISITGITMDQINSIEWLPADGLSCTDCLNPSYVVTEDTEYIININYGIGCDVSLPVSVMAEEIPIIPSYTIPNVFSPNGDGSNDVFYIVPNEAGSNQIASMTIFDRWGNQLFRKENYINQIGQGWDGTYNGEELNPGVYVYVIEVLENDVIKPFYGDVTIVK